VIKCVMRLYRLKIAAVVVQFYREREQVLQREDRFKMLTQ
jgi:hypothetical protein